jgi:hypothetical protein
MRIYVKCTAGASTCAPSAWEYPILPTGFRAAVFESEDIFSFCALPVLTQSQHVAMRSGRIEARTGLRMMPTFSRSPYHSVRRVFPGTAGRLAFRTGRSQHDVQLKPAPGIRWPSPGLRPSFARLRNYFTGVRAPFTNQEGGALVDDANQSGNGPKRTIGPMAYSYWTSFHCAPSLSDRRYAARVFCRTPSMNWTLMSLGSRC